MNITLKFLESKNACKNLIIFFQENYIEIDDKSLISDLMAKEKYTWVEWLIKRLLTKDDFIRTIIFLAEQVLYLLESKYPNDNRPRLAIEAANEAAKNYLINKTKDAVVYTALIAAYDTIAADYAAVAASWSAADRVKIQIKILEHAIKLLNENEDNKDD
jgi:hypothetical protein